MPNNQFRDYIHGAAPLAGQLGLTHVTDCARLSGLLQSGKLEARQCPVFQETLLYLFYGRPAYRPSWPGGTTSNLDYARVCFILRDDAIGKAHRILPFDSGGFDHYKSAFHHSLEKEDFELAAGDHPLKLVGAFYSSLSDYYWMKPDRAKTFTFTQNIVRSYYQLITGGLAEIFDDRCAAIEIQLRDSLPLSGEVLAVIAPNSMFDDGALMDQIKAWGAEPRGYKLTDIFNPNEITGRLMDEVERFHKEQSWL